MEDPNIIVEWFKLVEKTIAQYGITSDDIYYFDESGFAIGVSVTTKIIT
jgi:RecB family endonuclease NucS